MTSASLNTDFSLETDAVPRIGRDNHQHSSSLSPSPTSTASSASILESDRDPGGASYWRRVEHSSAQECPSQTSLRTGLVLASGPLSSSPTLVSSASSVSTSSKAFEEGQDRTKRCDADNCIDPYADLESLTLRDEIHPSDSRGLVDCNERILEGKGKGKARYSGEECTFSPPSEGSSIYLNNGFAENGSFVTDGNNEDSVNDRAADLVASIVTIKPPSPSTLADQEGDLSAPPRPPSRTSTAASPHSDRSYTFEVRPPSTLVFQENGATPTVQQQALHSFYASPTASHIPLPSQGFSQNARFDSGLPQALDHNNVLSPGARPVPPITSMRSRFAQVQQAAEPMLSNPSWSTMENPGLNYTNQPQDNPLRPSAYRPLVTETGRDEFFQNPMSSPWSDPSAYAEEFFSPSAPSPLVWPPSQRSTLSSEAITPSQTGRSTRSTDHSPLWFPPMPHQSLYESPARMRTSFAAQRNNSLPPLATSPFQSPSPGAASNPPSAPERSRRFAAPLPPSPGSSLRTSAFNSPYMHSTGAASADSWGTAVDPSYTQPTPAQNASASHSELPLPVPPMPTNPPRVPWSSWVDDSPPWSEMDSSPWGWTPPGWTDQTHTRTPQFGSIPPSPAYVPPAGYMLLCTSCGSPPGACGCRRYSRMSSITPHRTGRQAAMPHPTFWFPDGTVTLEVEDVLFKVHKHFFERHSTHFRSIFSRRIVAPYVPPLRIPDTRRLDFERLLMVFYPSSYVSPDLTTVEEWTSVLTLAVRWRMDELISLTIQKLSPITSAVDKISLAKKFGLFGYNLVPGNNNQNRDWLLPALKELCTRSVPLRMEEARKLDMWTVIKVWEVQFEIMQLGVDGHNNGSRIERLIKRRFGLE